MMKEERRTSISHAKNWKIFIIHKRETLWGHNRTTPPPPHTPTTGGPFQEPSRRERKFFSGGKGTGNSLLRQK